MTMSEAIHLSRCCLVVRKHLTEVRRCVSTCGLLRCVVQRPYRAGCCRFSRLVSSGYYRRT